MQRSLTYADGATPLTGELFIPAGKARAAVLLLPTIAGANAPMLRRAERLRDLGYLTLIADYYGAPTTAMGGTLSPQDGAEALRGDWTAYRARLAAGYNALSALDLAARLPLAVIGYCMGGQAALELARMGKAMMAAVSFHGILSTERPVEAGTTLPPMLICHGHLDPMVPPEQVRGFEAEMDGAGARYSIHSYAKAKHGFTDPGSDARGIPAIAYDAEADAQSWSAMLTFFAIHVHQGETAPSACAPMERENR